MPAKDKMVLMSDKYIWILLIVSLSTRIYMGFFTYVIQNDSVAFMQNAEYFASGDFLSGLRHDYHPLYPLIMAGLYKVITNIELSGMIIAIFFGTFTVIVFYLIGKRIFGREISFVSSIILAFHPCAVRFSADIISESTYFFFFTSALGLGFFAITNRKPLLFALTGICTAFAYLTRPEGIGIIFIIICWYFLKDFTKIKIIWKEKLVSFLILVVSFLALSSPYLVYIKKETGVWHLTKKKSLSQIVGIEEVLSSQTNEFPQHHVGNNLFSNLLQKGNKATVKKTNKNPIDIKQLQNSDNSIAKDVDKGEKPDADKVKQKDASKTKILSKQNNSKSIEEIVNKKKDSNIKIMKQSVPGKIDLKIHLKSILYILNKYLNTFHPFLFIFFIIGMINWTRIRKERLFGFYVTTIVVFYLFILYRLSITNIASDGSLFLYPSRRHLMPIIIPIIFCTGIGVYTAGIWIHERFHVKRLVSSFGELLGSVWIIQLIILILIVGVLLPKTLKPQRADKLGIKKAGQWIKENSDKPLPTILSSTPRNAYYAGGRHIQMGNVNDIVSIAGEKNLDYIIIRQKEYSVIEKELLQSIKNKQITLVYKYPKKNPLNGNSTFVYKVVY